jgi:sigma-B regulation protein RsbU (phosphoserine phosphatase)
MLLADAVPVALSGALLLIGLLALVVTVLLRRRAAALLWIAAFANLYACRLLIRTQTFHFYVGAPRDVWEYVAAAITYAIPIPIVLLAREMFSAWRRFWTLGALGLTAFAVCAIASDAILERPFAASTPNNLIAIAFFIGVLAWVLRPRPTPAPSQEFRMMRLGVLAVIFTAIADNLRGLRIVAFPGSNLEPFGFTVFIACLGAVTIRRALRDGERLIAIERELEIAREIQSSILPQSMPHTPGLTVVARYRPMTAVAGDYYDFLEVDSQRLGILVADVSGHGVPAALIASMVKMALAAQRSHADSPAAVLAGMNEALSGRLAGRYVTAAYLFIDTESRVVRYSAAGHPPMLRATRSNGRVDEVEQNGLILGFAANQQYRELEDSLRHDDRFLLYTDGLIEASKAEDPFGLERLKSTLAAAARLETSTLAESVLTAVDTWSPQQLDDDLTLVVVDWTGQP